MKSACSKILIAILIRVNFERKERGETKRWRSNADEERHVMKADLAHSFVRVA
jgi:hypothetical protein